RIGHRGPRIQSFTHDRRLMYPAAWRAWRAAGTQRANVAAANADPVELTSFAPRSWLTSISPRAFENWPAPPWTVNVPNATVAPLSTWSMHSMVPSYCGAFTFMNTHDGCPRYATIWPKTWPSVVWKVPVRSCDPWGTCAAADVGAGWCSCSVTTAVPATSNTAAAAATRTVRTRSLLAGRGSGMLGEFACSDSRWNNPSTNGSVGA